MRSLTVLTFVSYVFYVGAIVIPNAQHPKIRPQSDFPPLVNNFTIDREVTNGFILNGKPFRYFSGTMHYFRVPAEYWEDRMMKMKAAGLTTLQTYTHWALHEPFKGVYNFEGRADLFRYLETAQKVGLKVILRPGPFINAEQDMGALPFWLLHHDPLPLLRTSDPVYMKHVTDWYNYLLPKLQKYMFVYGGNVLMMQIENEYGAYWACDHKYVDELRVLLQNNLGPAVTLYTTDPANPPWVQCGHSPYAQTTLDFGIEVKNVSALFQNVLRPVEPTGPMINSEFYAGWIDFWGRPWQTRNKYTVAKKLGAILDTADTTCVNIYFFHGGTNYDFSGGSDIFAEYQPVITSYDCDGPTTEAGDTTDKYHLIREVLGQYVNDLPAVPLNSTKFEARAVAMRRTATLFDNLTSVFQYSQISSDQDPLKFEEILQDYGFVLYRHVITEDMEDAVLEAKGIRDYGLVFVDQVSVGSLVRMWKNFDLNLGDVKKGQVLEIFLENQGRPCWGDFINDTKGLNNAGHKVLLNSKPLEKWTMISVPLNTTVWKQPTSLPEIHSDNIDSIPSRFEGEFYNDKISANGFPADTFLRLDYGGWSKGVAFINGVNIGRYWPSIGPQVTLYVPGAYLNKDPTKANQLVLFETQASPCDNGKTCTVDFVTEPYLNQPVTKL